MNPLKLFWPLVKGLLSDVMERQLDDVQKRLKDQYGYDVSVMVQVTPDVSQDPIAFLKAVVKSIIWALQHG